MKCINEWFDRAELPCCPLCKTDLLVASRSSSTQNDGTAPAGRTTADNDAAAATAAGGNGGGGGGGGFSAWFFGWSDVQVVQLTGDNAV